MQTIHLNTQAPSSIETATLLTQAPSSIETATLLTQAPSSIETIHLNATTEIPTPANSFNIAVIIIILYALTKLKW